MEDPARILNEGELECLRLVYASLSLEQIAAELGLSVSGVKYRLKGARLKLRANSSDQAAAMLFGRPVPVYPSRTVPTKTVPPPPVISDAFPVAEAPVPEMVEERRTTYHVPPDQRPSPPVPTSFPIGRMHNDLTWPVKLLLGLLGGFLALAGVGAALTVGHALS